MKIEKYIEQIKRLPKNGKQIIGQLDGENIIVYQAFNANIAEYAVKNQKFGGEYYSFTRMSWIKPGFMDDLQSRLGFKRTPTKNISNYVTYFTF